MMLFIDNYDSFTYNLVQAFLVLGAEVEVVRNDAITRRRRRWPWRPTHCASRPVPGTPDDAGVSMDMIGAFAGQRADPGRVPGAPGDRRGLRRPGGAGARA